MILRKLDQSEHRLTRPLWEEVFTDDTKAFLDYYYYIKTRDNQIYVVEEEGQICSMLQLNPYQLMIGKKQYPSAYIIAVATKESFRGRGYMGALLRASLNDMYTEKIPFTFLMPAAEAIYTPYDFRFIYDQPVGTAGSVAGGENGGDSSAEKYSFSDAALWEAEEIAAFVNENFASRWQVAAVRDTAYYQTMIMEQQSEKGGVRLIRAGGSLKGVYAYAAEDGLEIREPLYLPGCGQAYLRSVSELAGCMSGSGASGGQGEDEIKVYACPEQSSSGKRPIIMARIIRLEELLKALTVPAGVSVDCSFAVLDPLIRQNSRVWRIVSGEDETELHVKETEDSQGAVTIAGFTEYLFGRITVQELAAQEDVVMTDSLAAELEKVTKLTEVFLNEVV